MGDSKTNPYVPFQMTYKLDTPGFTPLDTSIVPCNVGFDVRFLLNHPLKFGF